MIILCLDPYKHMVKPDHIASFIVGFASDATECAICVMPAADGGITSYRGFANAG